MRALRVFSPAHAAAFCAFAVDGLYLALISHQDTGITSRVAFVAASIAGAGAACTTAELVGGFAGGLAAAWAAATLWIWVVLGAASIGLAGVPAGILAVVALKRRRETTLAIAAGIAAALLTAAAGLAWTPA
jgi:hypothetical protein